MEKLRKYNGLKLTADGFDCALPVTIDSYNACSYNCLYCFADNTTSHKINSNKTLGVMSLRRIEDIFSGKKGKFNDLIRKALKYDNKKNGYPCPVQIGGVADPSDNYERKHKWLLNFLEIPIKYNQPIRISTKGTVLAEPEYLKKLKKSPHLFWVSFSIITPDDEIIEKVDKGAPNATERLKAMKKLSNIGVNVSLRLRPIIVGVSDVTEKYPKAYKTLIEKAKESGAKAISIEVAFMPKLLKHIKKKWLTLEKISKKPQIKIYKSFGKQQACTRPSYLWTENIMHDIVDVAHKNNIVVGVSDPVWKQLSDTGCCCGIDQDHPVFGNWEKENATHAMLQAQKTGKLIYFKDIAPKWAKDVLNTVIVNMGVGPKTVYEKRHKLWIDSLREVWNNINSERSVMNYFQGALEVAGEDKNGDKIYKYVGLNRKHLKINTWK
jgi:DNA repair photolyase